MYKRVVAIILILTLVCLNVPTNAISLALESNENNEDYVMVSQNDVIDKIDGGLIDNINHDVIVPTDNTISISLSENQVKSIEKAYEDVIIEKTTIGGHHYGTSLSKRYGDLSDLPPFLPG